MRRPLSLVCLLSALAAPLIIQADAANDLARSLAELVAAGVIEPADADGCDGPAQATMKAEADPGIGLDAAPSGVVLTAILPPGPSSRPDGPLTPGSAAWPSGHAPRRQARLQVFRF
jgi:hypothetical protein